MQAEDNTGSNPVGYTPTLPRLHDPVKTVQAEYTFVMPPNPLDILFKEIREDDARDRLEEYRRGKICVSWRENFTDP